MSRKTKKKVLISFNFVDNNLYMFFSLNQGLKERKRVSRRFPFVSRGVSLEAKRGVQPRRMLMRRWLMLYQQRKRLVPQTRATPQTLFMGNLIFTIEEIDVINFFKDVIEVVVVHFAIRDD
ncbi:hypothetical protein Hanom_Chr00s165109g01826591 [Helianthus anomalus]